VKVGADTTRDVTVIRSLRELVGPKVLLYVDANESYDVVHASRVIEDLARHGVAWVEDPCSIRSPRRLRRLLAEHSPVPILGDNCCFTPESVRQELEDGTTTMVMIKVARTGFTDSQRIAVLAEQFGVSCVIGTQADSTVGTMAAAHFAVAHTALAPWAEIAFFERLSGRVTEDAPTVRDGCLSLTDEPGFGVRIDERLLARYRVER
jgi:L-Ala-D/L-Glu epimerase